MVYGVSSLSKRLAQLRSSACLIKCDQSRSKLQFFSDCICPGAQSRIWKTNQTISLGPVSDRNEKTPNLSNPSSYQALLLYSLSMSRWLTGNPAVAEKELYTDARKAEVLHPLHSLAQSKQWRLRHSGFVPEQSSLAFISEQAENFAFTYTAWLFLLLKWIAHNTYYTIYYIEVHVT